MTTVAKVVELVKKEQAYTNNLRARYEAAQDTPEIIAFLEQVDPLLQAGWARQSPMGEPPVIYRHDRLGWVALAVQLSEEHEGRLTLVIGASVGFEFIEFDNPEEILAFVAEVEQESALSPV